MSLIDAQKSPINKSKSVIHKKETTTIKKYGSIKEMAEDHKAHHSSIIYQQNGQTYDYHDYPDDEESPYPDHFVLKTCSRCGKQFYI